MGLAANLKLELLTQGMRIDFPSLKGWQYKMDKHLHNRRHFAGEEVQASIPQELMVYDTENAAWLCVGVLCRPDSPYQLGCDASGPYLTYVGEQLDMRVSFLEEPVFWRDSTSDSVPMYKLLSVPGRNELTLWTWHDCAFQYEGIGCAFCTTTPTSRIAGTGPESQLLSARGMIDMHRFGGGFFSQHYPVLRRRSEEAVRLALSTDFSCKDYWFTITGGSLPLSQLDDNNKVVASLMSDLHEAIPALDRARSGSNIMPPNDLSLIHEMKSAGAGFCMINLEIWDESVLSRICPAKHRYGKEAFLLALEYAVGVFGPGNVWCSFVCGLEPLHKQLEGFRKLAEMGVVPGSNVFHRDPSVSIDWVAELDSSGIADYYRQAARILREHALKPFYCIESRRSSLMWEAYLDML